MVSGHEGRVLSMKYVSKDIQIDATHIHFIECGKGKPVILIHGLTNNWEGHIPLATFLGKTHKLYILDMPGYGDSGRLPYYSVETMSFYLQKFVLAIGVHPVAVVGLSMGAYIAADFGKTYRHLVTKSVIMGPPLNDKGRKAEVLKFIMRSVDVIPAGRSMMKKVVETKLHAYVTAKYLNMYRFNKRRIDKYGTTGRKKMAKDVYIEMCKSAGDYDLDATLIDAQVPTLLLFGKEDRISSPVHAQTHTLPHNGYLTMAVVPEAGHVVSFEKPKEAACAINSFLAE